VPEDVASCEEGLRALVRSLARALTDAHWDQLAPALILLSRQHPELADLDSEMKRSQHEATEAVLRRGIEEGVLDPAVLDDVNRTIAMVIGPLAFAGLSGMATVDDALADACVDQFLAGQKVVDRS
jgi:hypothetical protein